jgi:hypothetical protein
MTRIGPRFLLVGGYDGKSTFGDMWWLVNEEDEIAKRAVLSPASSLQTKDLDTSRTPPGRSPLADSKTPGENTLSPLNELRQRLGLPADVAIAPTPAMATEDEELLALGEELLSERDQNSAASAAFLLKVVRDHWSQTDAHLIQIRELKPLLRDYRRLVAARQSRSGMLKFGSIDGEDTAVEIYRFFHLNETYQVRMDDIPALQAEYKQLYNLLIVADHAAS